MTRARTLLTLAALMVVMGLTAGAATAAWLGSGVGGAVAKADAIPQGSTPHATITTDGVEVTWAASTLTSASGAVTYDVRRHNGTSFTDVEECQDLAEVVCLDPITEPGTYTYRVTPQLGSWSGDESEAGNDVTIASGGPPSAPTITSEPSNPSHATSAQFEFSSAGAASYTCKLDAEPGYSACTSPTEYTGLADGDHTFSVKAVNPFGESAATSFAWTVDTQPPGEPELTAKPAAFTRETSARFEFTGGATTLPRSFKCKLDVAPAFTACSSPQDYSGLEDGSHTFTVVASNANGDSSVTSHTWVVDTVAPGITLSRLAPPANAAGWHNADVTVTWDCTDAGSGVVNANDSAVVSGEGANLSASGSCTDRAGNTAGASQTGIKIDKTNPTGAITAPAGDAAVSGTITVAATAEDTGGSGVASVQFQRRAIPLVGGAGTWEDIGPADTAAPYQVQVNTDDLTEMRYEIRAVTTDAAGNSASSQASSFDIRPRVVDVVLTNSGGTAGGGLVRQGDSLTVTFSHTLNQNTLCGSTSNDNSTSAVTISNAAGNDRLTTSLCPNLGTIHLGQDYVTGTVQFGGNGNRRSTVVWGSTTELKITLGEANSNTANLRSTAVAASQPVIDPADTVANDRGVTIGSATFTAASSSRF